MQAAADASEGAMVSLLGLDEAQTRALCAEAAEGESASEGEAEAEADATAPPPEKTA